jgi:hypothetical protein
MYLFIIKCGDEAERKRMEYIVEKWEGKLNITKPDGLVILADGDANSSGFKEFTQQLLSRSSQISSENFTMYQIEMMNIDIEKQKKEINLELHEKRDTIEKLLNFVMARQKALVTQVSTDPYIKYYEVTTKKGKAEIRVLLVEKVGSVNLRIDISGYGEVVDMIYSRIKDEMDYFGV